MLRNGKDQILLDCGEGTQRQIMVSPASFMKIRGVFVTHMHGDHFYGLAPLVQTMGLMGRKEPLILRGPEGFSGAVGTILGLCPGDLGFELDIEDMGPGGSVMCGGLRVSSFATSHGILSEGYIVEEPDQRGKVDTKKAASLGVSSEEDLAEILAGGTVRGVRAQDICGEDRRGLRVAYTGDTGRCPTIRSDIEGCDLLIHESTYAESEKQLADGHFHSTARYAAENARDGRCGALILTHFSNRYKNRSVMLDEAREVFKNTYLAQDFALFRLTRDGLRSV